MTKITGWLGIFFRDEGVEEIRVESSNPERTGEIAVLLAEASVGGDVICLNGDLGAGKTTFTQHFAKGLGVDEKEYVTSPSFAIMHEYSCRIPMYHFDFYRLGASEEVIELGFEEYFYGNGVCVLEWSDIIKAYLPDERLEILIEYQTECSRMLTFKLYGKRWQERLEKLIHSLNER